MALVCLGGAQVYHSQWKGEVRTPPANARTAAIAYGALRVGDAASSYDEVSTKESLLGHG